MGKRRYNGDDNARSSTHTGQCTRKYESNFKKQHRKPTDSSNGRSNIDDQAKQDKSQQSITPKQVNT